MKSPIARDSSRFSVFKTIRLGTGLMTGDDFRRTLQEKGLLISVWAYDLLGRLGSIAATEEVELDLVAPSTEELGFPDGASRREIYDRAIELGLALCPIEAAPQLSLQYEDQQKREFLTVGTEPVRYSDKLVGLFGVERGDDGRGISARGGDPERHWSSDSRWVFVKPRNQQ
ncbi:MAG: hypothetical protein NTY11_00365 [Candidatus Parcubacteria bacterium]|nr:hypothetical protein [Candidatus Parcubacteria bacterium]